MLSVARERNKWMVDAIRQLIEEKAHVPADEDDGYEFNLPVLDLDDIDWEASDHEGEVQEEAED